MVIDDEKDVCDFVKNFFESEGLQVFTALSGQEGLKIFEKEKPQIIILDILMKGLNGIEVLRRLKQIDSNNEVFMVTRVNDKPELVVESKNLGAAGYITKPLTLENLKKVVMNGAEEFKQRNKE